MQNSSSCISNTKNYKIPYMGSKGLIVDKIYDAINNDLGNTNCLFATNQINTIYDLFIYDLFIYDLLKIKVYII